ncbi:DUF4349 domain-containing protein [Paenibacillus mendelii]|uniref:DUF4349 domain-containing protein n=1 Tax=Paenibacillus mendelii TaxID=206163 RepID=A0ABV6JHM1_9BACL|nr:DUF4349 domain-containing protein [Paenibacillus mendelii]MCQ6558276.1 DUF4349 domain-containing protein [Paenibacillus mendelii]
MIKGAYRQKQGWIRLYTLFFSVLILAAAAGCSGSSNNSASDSAMKSNAGSATTEISSYSKATAEDKAAAGERPAENETTQASEALQAGTGYGSGAVAESGAEADGFSRKVIYRANVSMEVEEYAKAQTLLRNAIHLSGGYILQFSDQKSTAELGGTYTIKVPAGGFMSFLGEIEKIKHLFYETNMQGTDVTEEYVDLESRLKARQVVEARLLAFMDKATRADDLLKFSTELGEVQMEIERIKGRMRYLEQNVAFSTIELRMYERIEAVAPATKEKPFFQERLTNALSGSTTFLYEFAQGLLVLLAGALPILIVLALLGIPVYIAYRQRHKGRPVRRSIQVQAENKENGQLANKAPESVNQEEEL